MSRYTADFGPNVEDILCRATRVIRGPIPARVRAELRAAVKAGVLGHLKKNGLKPEIFFHPDHKHGAKERQVREAAYAVDCISGVMATKPVEERVDEAVASLGRSAQTTCIETIGGDPEIGDSPIVSDQSFLTPTPTRLMP